MDISYVSVLEYEFFANLRKAGNQSEIGQIIQAGDITNHEASSFFIQAEVHSISF
jgi:hypothetical protein